MPHRARALLGGTIALGAMTVLVASFRTDSGSLRMLAVLAAAAALSELFTIPADRGSLHPLDAHGFSLSASVHVAAILILGPWPAALVATFGVVAADSLARVPFHKVAYNASVFALAALAGGLAFEALGGVPGTISLPEDFPAIGVLVATAYAVNTLLIGAIVAATRRISLVALQRDKLRAELPAAAAEAGLGVSIALFAVREPWAIVALVPLAIAVYLSRSRLVTLRRETSHALETFANIVDERDSYTYRHSARVAEYIRELATALKLPSSQVASLRWAGRLHDLGKIRVDAAVLGKESALDSAEWAELRLHPRLSARLLRRFRFAAKEAQAVEYHHERADGGGYYGVDPHEIPLAAHFIVVADSFDAMTSDRPYRRGLARAAALAEIEANLGTHFHPAVGKAFVAVQRGEDPLDALTAAELMELRQLDDRGPRSRRSPAGALLERPELVALGGLAAALVGYAAGAGVWAALGLAPSACGLTVWLLGLRRAGRLETALAASAADEDAFSQVVARLVETSDLRWAGLVHWSEPGLAGTLDREWNGGPHRPTESALMSWLIRDAETREELVLAPGSEVGRSGVFAAVPLSSGASTDAHLVLKFGRALSPHVKLALVEAKPKLADAFLAPPAEEPPRLAAVS